MTFRKPPWASGEPRSQWPVTRRRAWVLGALIGVNVLIELILFASDLGLAPHRLRSLAYEYGAFWKGLLTNWRPNFPAQPMAMFLTYAFLHAGMGHLFVNMFTLFSLGSGVIHRVGWVRFLGLYLASILGGALGFGLLASTPQPMVGASGALFGLAGAWITWDFLEARQEAPWRTLALQLLFLAGMNLVLWWAVSGHLAWQAHLGGFVAGALCASAHNSARSRHRTKPGESAGDVR